MKYILSLIFLLLSFSSYSQNGITLNLDGRYALVQALNDTALGLRNAISSLPVPDLDSVLSKGGMLTKNRQINVGGTNLDFINGGSVNFSVGKMEINSEAIFQKRASFTGDTVAIQGKTIAFDKISYKGELAPYNDLDVPNLGYILSLVPKAYKATLSGTGSATITVTLPASATTAIISPGSADAANILYHTVSETVLTIYYSVAPPAGTNNLTYYIEYK